MSLDFEKNVFCKESVRKSVDFHNMERTLIAGRINNREVYRVIR